MRRLQALASHGLPVHQRCALVTTIGSRAFSDNQLKEVILPAALYADGKPSNVAFDDNPVGLKFYEYDKNAEGNRGRRLN